MGDSINHQTDEEFDAWIVRMMALSARSERRSDRPPSPKPQKVQYTMSEEKPMTSDEIMNAISKRYSPSKQISVKKNNIFNFFKIKNLFNFLLSSFIFVSIVFLFIFYFFI